MNDAVVLILVIAAVMAGLWILWAWTATRARRARSGAESPYARGLNLLIAGDRRGALIAFREAVTEDTTNTDAYLRLGDLLRQAGEPGKALQIHRDLTLRAALRPADRERVHESLTRDYMELGRTAEAIAAARRLREMNRKNRYALEALSQLHDARGEWDQAGASFSELVRLDGGEEKKRLALYQGFVASRLLAAGEKKEARRRFEAALALDSGCSLARFELGNLLLEEGETARAVEEWKTLARNSPRNAGLVFEKLERAYYEMGRFVEVIRFYEELLKTAPREAQPAILLALSEIEMRRGDYEAAGALVREALEIRPDSMAAQRNLLRIHQERGDSRRALAVVEQVARALGEEGGRAACRRCGAPLERPEWRCPRCGEWSPTQL